MEPISRRQTVAGVLGAGMLAAASRGGRAAAAVPAVDVQPPRFAVERGVRLRVLRPA